MQTDFEKYQNVLIMTATEKEEYDKLSLDEKDEYNFNLGKHPNWSHQQLMTKVAISRTTTTIVDETPEDIDVDDPKFMALVLKGAKDFLESIGCVATDIIKLIDNALGLLANIIDAGINYVGDKLKQFWNWLNG